MTELEKNRGAYHEDKHQRSNGDMSSDTIVGTAYLWDAHTIAEEAPLKASGEADWDKATKWHYEPDTFRPIAKETANGELFYIINDHLGTPREMFSEDGKLVWAAQYRTWGAVHKIWQADNDNDIRGPYPPPIRGNLAFKYDTAEDEAAQTCPIRFQGQWEDAETGLYYNRYRYYDPLAAQYISSDPIGLAGGLRPNGYVHNPAVWIDPWGLASKKLNRPTECCSIYSSYENARNAALKKLDEYGGLDPSTRKPMYAESFNGKNPAAGKEMGFEGRTPSGQPIRYYADYDPVKGTHINLRIGKGNGMVVNEAFTFPGSQQDYLNILKGLKN